MFSFKSMMKWRLNQTWFLLASLILWRKKKKKKQGENISLGFSLYQYFDSDFLFSAYSFWAKKVSPDEEIARILTLCFSIIQCRLLADNHRTLFLCSYGNRIHLYSYFGQIYENGDFLPLHQQQNQKFLLSFWDISLYSFSYGMTLHGCICT